MQIDAHLHFWKYDGAQYNWMDERHTGIMRDFLPQDLEPLLRDNGFAGCIAVQARQSLEETRWLLELSQKHPIIKGVVGWVDLCSDQIEEQLQHFAKEKMLKGVRHVVHDEPDDLFMFRDDFRQGVSLLEKYKLTYDLLLFPKHISAAIELVREFPQQRFVLNHIAKPNIAQGSIQPWKDDLYTLAQSANVCCKLSGMVTEAQLNNWQASDFKPYLDIVFDAFGPDRLMIGSDWPVCTISGNYSSVMEIVIRYLDQYPVTIQEKVLGLNCMNFL